MVDLSKINARIAELKSQPLDANGKYELSHLYSMKQAQMSQQIAKGLNPSGGKPAPETGLAVEKSSKDVLKDKATQSLSLLPKPESGDAPVPPKDSEV